MQQILWQKYKSLERIFTLYSHKKNVVRKMAIFFIILKILMKILKICNKSQKFVLAYYGVANFRSNLNIFS